MLVLPQPRRCQKPLPSLDGIPIEKVQRSEVRQNCCQLPDDSGHDHGGYPESRAQFYPGGLLPLAPPVGIWRTDARAARSPPRRSRTFVSRLSSKRSTVDLEVVASGMTGNSVLHGSPATRTSCPRSESNGHLPLFRRARRPPTPPGRTWRDWSSPLRMNNYLVFRDQRGAIPLRELPGNRIPSA